ncbi:sulfur carrier protein ThiS [SAR202 cluster bacterium AC-409-J13_OGT_754m]|nr:sulfur carrier protein ThiS [SAR202 cluster bacterium AC-409-J13_OGT_754m]
MGLIMIDVTVNGKSIKLDSSMNLTDLLRFLNVDSQYVAVAHNGEVVQVLDLMCIVVNDGDEVEIVRPVGGG